MSETINQAISSAVLRLLRPLVRVLLRNGMPYGAFADLAKRVFIDVAITDYGIPGRKSSLSRASVITGLSRKEVQRVLQLALPDDTEAVAQYNRAARVLSGWARERLYLDDHGRPLPLRFDSGDPNFTKLVKQFSGDVPPRAILDELIRVGAVIRDQDGLIHLVRWAYVPQTGEIEKLGILGRDAGELIATIDHNLNCDPTEAHLQRKVSYDNLPVEAVSILRELAMERGQTLLEELDRWMSGHDRDTSSSVSGTGRTRASIGIYYFEEEVSGEELT